jgi:hypothetical protein
MIRNSHAEFFKWLPIGRIYSQKGSGTWRELGAAKAGRRVMDAIKGNIWAIRGFPDLVVFLSRGR